MNPRLALKCCFLFALAGAAQAQDDKNGDVFEPGVRHVCVPAADGEGWDCGTDDKPPASYREPTQQAELSDTAIPMTAAEATPPPDAESATAGDEPTPPPPPFLADPELETLYAPVEEVADTQSTDATASAIESATAPVTEPVTVPESIVEAAPQATSEPVREAVAEPAPAVADAPSAPQFSGATIGGAAQFAQLTATAYTLQLAYAANTSSFADLVAALGLDPAQCYALQVRGPGGSTWLLAHGAFDDVAAARNAQAALPKVAGLSAQWPRRIGALQAELDAQGR